MAVSKTVEYAIKRMYARMAHKAASKAIELAGSQFGDERDCARKIASDAESWMIRAGAEATRWHCN